ncbi:MAG: stage III sporulation protein AE [Oscillospiraceae bacterium]|nr:stage III sporulation protein AE [Oscillospiraceae bacterium]
MKRRKRWIVLLFTVCCVFFWAAPTVYGEEASRPDSAVLEQQLEESGAKELPDRLPEETREGLSEIGVDSVDLEQVGAVDAGDILSSIVRSITEKLPSILTAFFSMIAVMLLLALVNSMKLSLGEQPVGGVIHLVGMLCVIGIVLTPVVTCITEAATVISGGAYFMLGCIPVLVGFLFAAGQVSAGTSFSALLLALCNVVSFAASHFIVPVLHIFLGFSLVSSLSPNLNLNGICKSFYAVLKWILGFAMTIFSGLLTMQGLLGSAVDVTTNKSVKFVVSSFVPIVGTALGEAFGTVHSCAKALKSGVGAFGILAIGFLFLPILLQCVLWMLSLSVGAGIGDVFDLRELSALLRSIAKVISMLVAILLCCVVMLVVSLEIIMMTGGGTG